MSLSAEQLIPLPGYEQYFGSKKAFVGELAGPADYATGGQTIHASQLGWGGFDSVFCPMLSVSGTYSARVQPNAIDAAPSEPQGAVTSVNVVWFVVATGAQVAAHVDLSTEVIRLQAQGV